MTTVAEIVAAAAQLSPDEFLELRRELNRLELRLWDSEFAETRTDVSKDDIDRMVRDREPSPEEEDTI